MSTATDQNAFVYTAVYEYDNAANGEGKRRISGHYRVYRDDGAYLGYIARDDDGHPRLRWFTIIPNPHHDASEGVGFIEGRYVGRGVNPRMILRRGETRDDVSSVLARHWDEFPDHRPIEVRPICERLSVALR